MVVDMSIANSAISRSKRMLPVPEKMHCELAGSKYFTKLDMNSAYHQITLVPESRYITAFTTHLRLGTRQCFLDVMQRQTGLTRS